MWKRKLKIISVHEHDRICVGGEENNLSLIEIAALEKEQKRLNVSAIKWISRNEVATNQFVGLLTADCVCLEILPKIDRLNDTSIRSNLARMIFLAHEINVLDGNNNNTETETSTLMEIIISLFARKCLENLKYGLTRNYINISDDIYKLKGRLNVNRHFTKNLSNPAKVSCSFDEFNADTPLNRLLFCAIDKLIKITNSYNNKKSLIQIASHFEEVSNIDINSALSTKIVFNRQNQKWEDLEKISRLILQGLYQSTHSGRTFGFSLLFDMNNLFEKYIAKVAKKALQPYGFSVFEQKPVKYLCSDNKFMMQPDLCILANGKTIILDTKWKTVDLDDVKASQSDLYQMFAYSVNYNAEKTILLYPHNGTKVSSGIQRTYCFNSNNKPLLKSSIDLTDLSKVGELLKDIVFYNFSTEQDNVVNI